VLFVVEFVGNGVGLELLVTLVIFVTLVTTGAVPFELVEEFVGTELFGVGLELLDTLVIFVKLETTGWVPFELVF